VKKMSLPITHEMKILIAEIDPYVNHTGSGSFFIEGTPERIKELHKELLRLSKEQQEFEESLW